MAISLCVVTPMYGGQCVGAYNVSVGRLRDAIVRDGNKFGSISLANESLVNRARNSLVWQFLNCTDADTLLFCDADQAFQAPDVLKMIAADKPVIAAPVPMKGFDWEAIAMAARRGVAPEDLHFYGGIFNLEELDPEEAKKPSTWPRRVRRIGAAFMMIQRHVFQSLAGVMPRYTHDLPDEMNGAEVIDFFPTRIDEGRLMSEDYGFLNAWRKLGGEVWLAPWVRIIHFGHYAFSGKYDASLA